MAWFSNRGQILQIVIATVSCAFAGVRAWPEMKTNQLLSPGAILFYMLAGLLVALVVHAAATFSAAPAGVAMPQSQSPEHRSEKTLELVKLQSAALDPRSTDPKITYKAKLRCVFTNESKQVIEVLPPSWITAKEQVGVQSPFASAYQVEATLGGWQRGAWDKEERKKTHVSPGESFRVWVGLDSSQSHEYLENRRITQQLGTLLMPIRLANQEERKLKFRV